ncbi:MAG: acyltransferase [Microbacteriaceae bacterium]|nr:acyltransferase [Microbacteriaceae bacterium]
MSISSLKVAEPGHVLGIDSLRALAVWVVIVYHLNASFLPGGFVGVDIFFAISGFVITKSLLERAPKSVFSFFTGFYRRRFVRIAPALFAYLIIFSALASYFIPKAFLSGGIYETARWAVIGASNIQLVQSSDGYFGERMDYNPFIQTWSLGVEEQFYLFYPLIISFLVFAIIRSRKALERLSVLALILVTVLSLGVSVWQTNNDGLSAFYLLPARFWELALGGLLCILITRFNRFTNLGPRARSLVFAFGLGLVTLSLVFANVNEFPYWWAIPPVIGALLLIHSSNTVGDSNSKVFKLLTAKHIVYFGKISYSLYLWHWGVFVLMRWTLGLSLWWHYLVALVLTVGLAAASYKFIETPFRTGTFIRKMPDWRVIVAGSLVALVSVVAVDFSKSEMTRRAIAITDPQFKDSKAIADKLATIPKSDIGVGHSIVFVGDSHAGHYKYMGQWIFKKKSSTSAAPMSIFRDLQPTELPVVQRMKK